MRTVGPINPNRPGLVWLAIAITVAATVTTITIVTTAAAAGEPDRDRPRFSVNECDEMIETVRIFA